MKTLRTFFGIVDRHTITVVGLALAATWLAIRFDLAAEIPTTLIGIAVIFPIVFSIQAAWERREQGLRSFAGMRAHAASIYYAHRDWVGGGRAGDAHDRLVALLHAVADYLSGHTEELAHVYERFSQVSRSMEELRTGRTATSSSIRSPSSSPRTSPG